MTKILIISPYFFPNINPRPYRWTKIAEQWANEGHEVHVVCEKRGKSPSDNVIVHNIGHAALKSFLSNQRGESSTKISKPSLKSKLFQWLNDKVWKRVYFPDDSCVWYFSAKKKCLQLLDNQQFDIVVSSALPFTTHLVALSLKKKYPNLYWIADTGDPFSLQKEVPLNNFFLYKKWNFALEKKVVELANLVPVTTLETANLYAEYFHAQKEKFIVIPPLATSSSLKKINLQNADNQINIAYFGKFYQHLREPREIINWIEKLLKVEPTWRDILKIHLFGDVFENFVEELSACPNIILHGLIPREEVIPMMSQFDFLLNVSNTTSYQLPSKAPDYLQSGKPIINLYTMENDCFKFFFSNYPLILNFKNSDTELKTLIDFLKENKGKIIDEKLLEKLLLPYQIETVAGQYLEQF